MEMEYMLNSQLSNQESKILKYLSEGKLYKEIAVEMGISVNTVKKHLKNVYRKLQVSSRKEAALKYHAEMPMGKVG